MTVTMLPPRLLESLGWVLLHFLWQGAVLGVLAATMLVVLRRHSAPARYLAGCVVLVLMAIAPVATFLLTFPHAGAAGDRGATRLDSRSVLTSAQDPRTESSAAIASAGPAVLRAAPDSSQALHHRAVAWVQPRLPWIVGGWLAGVLLLSLKLLSGWIKVQRLRGRFVQPVTEESLTLLSDMAHLLRLSRPVQLLVSGWAQVPLAIGWLRPVILLPASALTALTPQQLRSVLAHELAHIRRYDYLVNILQCIIETVLFYHPAVWWISRRVRIEREYCCDDMAVAACGDGATYARALAELEQIRAPRLAAAANAGSLLYRIQRIVGLTSPRLDHPSRGIAGALTAALLLAFAVGAQLSTVAANDGEKCRAPAGTTTQPATQSGTEAAGTERPKTTLHVQVVRGDNRQPLSGVQLRITIDDHKREEVTDAQGRFALSIPPEWTDVVIRCTYDGFVPTSAFWFKRHYALGIPPEITIPMEPGTSIGGLVRDEAGKPVAGAEVSIDTSGPSVDVGHAVFGTVRDHVVKADASGRWRCDLLPTRIERLTIRLTHPDYLSDTQYFQRPTPPLEDLRKMRAVQVMGKGLTISGSVSNAKGEPVAKATVSRDPNHRVCSWYKDVETDAQGRFVFEHVPPGQAVITVSAGGYAPSLTILKAEGSPPPLAIQLEPGHTIRARVVDPKGKPVAGAWVWSRKWRGYATFLREAETDAEGRFAIEDAPADEVLFEIGKDGYFEAWDHPLTAQAGEQLVTLNHVLKVHGKVVDTGTGQPLSMFEVVPGFSRGANGPIFWDEMHRKKFKDGQYETAFEFPQSGHALRIEAEGYRAATSPTYTGTEGDVIADFKLEPGRGPAGVVKDPEGKPVAGAQVSVAMEEDVVQVHNGRISGNSRYKIITTGADGSFGLPVIDGDYVVVAVHDRGYASCSRKDFEARPELKLEPWARVEGVLKVAIRPGITEHVSARYPMPVRLPGVYLWCRADVDSSGRFVIDRLVPGKVRIAREVILKQEGEMQTVGQGEFAEVTLRAGETARVTLGK